MGTTFCAVFPNTCLSLLPQGCLILNVIHLWNPWRRRKKADIYYTCPSHFFVYFIHRNSLPKPKGIHSSTNIWPFSRGLAKRLLIRSSRDRSEETCGCKTHIVGKILFFLKYQEHFSDFFSLIFCLLCCLAWWDYILNICGHKRCKNINSYKSEYVQYVYCFMAFYAPSHQTLFS